MKIKQVVQNIILAAVSLLLALSVCGCAKKAPEPDPIQMTDDEAKAVMKELIPASMKINEIFFGKGLVAEKGADNTSMIFLPVSADCGYSSVAEIKTDAEKVYSKDYLNSSVYTGVFDGVASVSADGVVDFSVNPRYKEINGKLYVNTKYTPFELKTELLTDTATVVSTTASSVTVRMSYKIDEKNSGELDINIVMQDGGWRLDTPSY